MRAERALWPVACKWLSSRPGKPGPASPRLPCQPCTHRARRGAGLAVAIVERVAVDQAEDVGAFLVRAHDQAAARREGAPERLLLVAGRVRALQAADEGIALLLGDDEGREAAAPALDLRDAVALPGPGPDQRQRLLALRRHGEGGGDGSGGQRAEQGLHLAAAMVVVGQGWHGSYERRLTSGRELVATMHDRRVSRTRCGASHQGVYARLCGLCECCTASGTLTRYGDRFS